MSVTIRDKDKGATALLARLLAKGALSVGVLSEQAAATHEAKDSVNRIKDIFKGPGATITIGEIAEIHEFGLGTAPRRSFLADWADEKKAEIQNVVIQGGAALVRGKSISSPAQLLNQIGQWAVGSIQARMATSIPPPLAPETIQRKGSSVSLIDTGQLRSSITYRVELAQVNKAATRAGLGGAA